uniref:Hypotheticial protein n=1 Tax=Schistosoma japonicum TaxID=6182 RepID=C1LJR7_SCHJA|nr:hypotheticial protein [Schistosoma japonicum]CAX74947.1 hypotheticial protein [Schistosoma japonicum]
MKTIEFNLLIISIMCVLVNSYRHHPENQQMLTDELREIEKIGINLESRLESIQEGINILLGRNETAKTAKRGQQSLSNSLQGQYSQGLQQQQQQQQRPLPQQYQYSQNQFKRQYSNLRMQSNYHPSQTLDTRGRIKKP